ncbi:hypothetical protein GGE24_007573 [Bradyrhizobium centrosematis]|nr:hypothetical protein [Bradyrhizobium centrosematis]MCS3778197.1 hypothetical protein [Bradyrhizobium centrosematis]
MCSGVPRSVMDTAAVEEVNIVTSRFSSYSVSLPKRRLMSF